MENYKINKAKTSKINFNSTKNRSGAKIILLTEQKSKQTTITTPPAKNFTKLYLCKIFFLKNKFSLVKFGGNRNNY